jgi:hypothetical protein
MEVLIIDKWFYLLTVEEEKYAAMNK